MMSLFDKFTYLNRDEFPKWVSDEALVVAEHFLHTRKIGPDGVLPDDYDEWLESELSITPKSQSIYLGLLKSLEMKKAWLKLASLDSQSFHGQIWFACALWWSIPHELNRDVISAEANKWKVAICESLSGVQKEVSKMPTNLHELSHNFPAELLNELGSWDAEMDDASPTLMPSMSDVLGVMIRAVMATRYDPGFHGQMVNGPTVDRNLFVRSLACAFHQTKISLDSVIVAVAASTAFGMTIAPNKIARTIGDLDWKAQPLVIPSEYEHIVKTGDVKLLINYFS